MEGIKLNATGQKHSESDVKPRIQQSLDKQDIKTVSSPMLTYHHTDLLLFVHFHRDLECDYA